MKEKNLNTKEVLNLATLLLGNAVTIYELEKMSGVPAESIIKAFEYDLYEIDRTKAIIVNRVLTATNAAKKGKYLRELAI